MGLQEWYRIKPLVQETSVEKIEKEYGVTLSSGLKKCVLENNGGRPRPNIINLGKGQEFDVKLLLSYNENDIENIYKVIQFFVDKFGKKVVPFAVDSGGNYYCECEDRIVLCLQNDSLLPICKNFDEFLQMLSEE